MDISVATVKFVYRNWRGAVEERTVTPSVIYFGTSPHHAEVGQAAERHFALEAINGSDRAQWYLVGWCHDRQAERHFALESIIGGIVKAKIIGGKVTNDV